MIYSLARHHVTTDGDRFFVAPSAAVIGQVTLGTDASVWFGAVVRGDGNTIRIGARSNVQDTAVIHVDNDAPVKIADDVTIGHGAIVHGCTIGRFSLIGIGATILSHAVIGEHCLVGAGALVTERKEFPDRSLIIGAPARVARQLNEAEMESLRLSAEHYAALGREYRAGLQPASDYATSVDPRA
ncbi:MAG TPA: gamma carbonic anhydrase family protein [Gammaproteobacteria bacterium]|nr:gamma carbonic anhydrase family protein [Gammaproteobacteria bacterium]